MATEGRDSPDLEARRALERPPEAERDEMLRARPEKLGKDEQARLAPFLIEREAIRLRRLRWMQAWRAMNLAGEARAEGAPFGGEGQGRDPEARNAEHPPEATALHTYARAEVPPDKTRKPHGWVETFRDWIRQMFRA